MAGYRWASKREKVRAVEWPVSSQDEVVFISTWLLDFISGKQQDEKKRKNNEPLSLAFEGKF